MTKRIWILLSLVVSTLLLTTALVRAVYADPLWVGGEPMEQLSDTGYNRYTAMAMANNGSIALVWSRVAPDGRTGPRWLTLTQRTSGGWETPLTLRTVSNDINQPAVGYLGTSWHVAWTEGPHLGPVNLMVTRQGGTEQVLSTGLYNYPEPHIASAGNGLHMVYSAARSTVYPSDKADLYYTFYPANGNGWAIPSVAITRSQVIPGETGEVWRPRLALNATGTEVHLVWEQRTYLSGREARYEVWYVKGTHTGSSVAWGTPKRLSPEGQNALRPDIAVDDGGYPHVVWTEALGPLGRPEAQYVDYRKQIAQDWSKPKRIDPNNAAVSNLNPTYVQASIAAHGDRLCVTWHGSRDPNLKEELLLTCSDDRGASWQTTVNISNTPDQLSLYPNVLFDQQGKLQISWIESRSTNWFWDYDAVFRREKTSLQRLFLPIVLKNKS